MKHKIITFGELMLRLSPDNNERFTQAHSYEAVYGGGKLILLYPLPILMLM